MFFIMLLDLLSLKALQNLQNMHLKMNEGSSTACGEFYYYSKFAECSERIFQCERKRKGCFVFIISEPFLQKHVFISLVITY